MAAAATVPASVGVSRRRLAVLGPPAENLIGAVVTTATGHAWRGLIDLKPRRGRGHLRRVKGVGVSDK